MPRSKSRIKSPACLSGIPRNIVAKSPQNWPDARRALWCRAYIAGASGGRQPSDRDLILAFRQGQRETGERPGEIAQAVHTRAESAARGQRYRDERDAMNALNLHRRLSILNGGDSLDFDAFGSTIAEAAAMSLGIGAAILPIRRRP